MEHELQVVQFSAPPAVIEGGVESRSEVRQESAF